MTIITPSEEPDERLLSNRSTVVRHRDARFTLSGMRCGGCGREVAQLDWAASRILRRAEPGKQKSLRAFECAWCEVVMFEDEIVNGQFVPHFVNPGPTLERHRAPAQMIERKSQRVSGRQR